MNFDFDDDFFDSNNNKNALSCSDVILEYKPKQVLPGNVLNETSSDFEEFVNLTKLKADYHFYMKNFRESYELYKQCLSINYIFKRNTCSRIFPFTLLHKNCHFNHQH